MVVDERFKVEVDKYMQAALRKGVPSLFVNLKKLYADPIKEDTIEKLVEEYLQNLKTCNTFTKSSDAGDEIEEPTAYLWTLYLLAQHYDNKRDTTRALKLIDEAIEHTPTLVELYMTKGRILKVRTLNRYFRWHHKLKPNLTNYQLFASLTYIAWGRP